MSATIVAQRMRLLFIAYKLEQPNGTAAVLDAYDRLEARITRGLPVGDEAPELLPIIAEFLAARCEEDKSSKVKVGLLYKTFTSWCCEQGIAKGAVPSLRVFGQSIGFVYPKHFTNVVQVIGLRMREAQQEA